MPLTYQLRFGLASCVREFVGSINTILTHSNTLGTDPLVQTFGELMRKICSPRNFKSHVSPHEFLQVRFGLFSRLWWSWYLDPSPQTYWNKKLPSIQTIIKWITWCRCAHVALSPIACYLLSEHSPIECYLLSEHSGFFLCRS